MLQNIIYVFGFVVPFIYAEFSHTKQLAEILTVCSITMAALAFLEALDIFECGLSYFKSTWNFVDLTLYLSWYAFYILKCSSGFKHDIIEHMTHYYTNEVILMNILKVFVIFVSFLKVMSFCRVFEGFASLIMLLGTVVGDLFYF